MVADELGYDGIEFLARKIKRFLAQGHDIAMLADASEQAGTPALCISALADTENDEVKTHAELLAECEFLSAAAEGFGCPTIQLVFFNQSQSPDESMACNSNWSRSPGARFTVCRRAWRLSTTPGATTLAWLSTSGSSGPDEIPRRTRWPGWLRA